MPTNLMESSQQPKKMLELIRRKRNSSYDYQISTHLVNPAIAPSRMKLQLRNPPSPLLTNPRIPNTMWSMLMYSNQISYANTNSQTKAIMKCSSPSHSTCTTTNPISGESHSTYSFYQSPT
jgi:hypothetical protein